MTEFQASQADAMLGLGDPWQGISETWNPQMFVAFDLFLCVFDCFLFFLRGGYWFCCCFLRVFMFSPKGLLCFLFGWMFFC